MFDTGQKDSQTIGALTFKLTSHAHPEQYEVFDNDNIKVAYVRLRHGMLYVSHPDDVMQKWWSTHYDDTAFAPDRRLKGDGYFDDDKERIYFLTLIAKIIDKKLNNPNWHAWQENGILALMND